MYSYNDWRSYELYHASAFPGKGFIKGKNTPEYNKWYYMTHPEKWGITKAAVGMYNKAKDFAENTETDLDDRVLEALGRGARGAKNALKNNSAVQDVRRSTEALQRRDSARRNAEAERAGAKNAERGRDASLSRKWGASTVANNPYASQAARDAASSAATSAGRRAKQLDNEAQFHTRNANNYSRQASQESANADAYARRARNTASRAVGNVVGNAIDAAKNAGQRVLDATTIDEKLGTAARSLRSGNIGGARVAAKSAAKEAGSRLKNAGQRVLDSTDLDDRAIGAAKAGVGAARAAGRRILDSTNIDENITNAVGVAKNHATNALGVAKNTVQNYRGLAENNRQIAEQGYKYGQALANAQREYDAAPNPNSKRMLDIAQRDYDNYTKGNRVAQIGAAAGRAGKSLNNAMNDVERVVGNRFDSMREGAQNAYDTTRDYIDTATGGPNRRQAERFDQMADNAQREIDEREASGRTVTGAQRDRVSALRTDADIARGKTPEGKVANTVKDAANSAGTAAEAKIAATKAVKDAVSDYWDAVDQYGANSPQAKAAATAAEGKLNSTAIKLIGNFGNAKNTIEDVIDDGVEWLDKITDGRFSAYEYSWDGPLTLRTTDTRDGSYHTDNLLTGKRTYVKNITIPSDDDKKKK